MTAFAPQPRTPYRTFTRDRELVRDYRLDAAPGVLRVTRGGAVAEVSVTGPLQLWLWSEPWTLRISPRLMPRSRLLVPGSAELEPYGWTVPQLEALAARAGTTFELHDLRGEADPALPAVPSLVLRGEPGPLERRQVLRRALFALPVLYAVPVALLAALVGARQGGLAVLCLLSLVSYQVASEAVQEGRAGGPRRRRVDARLGLQRDLHR